LGATAVVANDRSGGESCRVVARGVKDSQLKLVPRNLPGCNQPGLDYPFAWDDLSHDR
jgi:hypothetical protein